MRLRVEFYFHAIQPHHAWTAIKRRFDISGTYYSRYDLQNIDKSYTGIVSNSLNSPVVGVIPRWKHYALPSNAATSRRVKGRGSSASLRPA